MLAGISFNFHGTSFCFVNCHLAAHQNMIADRNLNVESILSSLHLGCPDFEITTQFCHLFFFGDLNYRIDMERDDVSFIIATLVFSLLIFNSFLKVVNLISEQKWDELLERDQLLIEQKKYCSCNYVKQQTKINSFCVITEKKCSMDSERVLLHSPQLIDLSSVQTNTTLKKWSTIFFFPTNLWLLTLKVHSWYLQGRVPSWCDRVLWRSLPGLTCLPNEYTTCPAITTR